MFIQLIEVLHNNTPWAVLGNDTQYEAQLGRIQGYREAIAVLMELTHSDIAPDQEEPITYKGDTFDIGEQ